jgi:hypothetical protein
MLGSFITGQDALLFKWAEVSVNASGKKLSIEKVINEVLRSPITARDILESKKIYTSILRKEGKVHLRMDRKCDHLIRYRPCGSLFGLEE